MWEPQIEKQTSPNIGNAMGGNIFVVLCRIMTRMNLIFTLTMCFGLLICRESLAQDGEKVTFHVSSVRSEDANDWCTSGKCSAKRFTIEGYTNSTEYVLACVETIANEPSPHYTVICPKVHAHNDYEARLGADYIAFGDGKKTSGTEPILSAYQIVSEKETAKRK
jgi:hypothetical protein